MIIIVSDSLATGIATKDEIIWYDYKELIFDRHVDWGEKDSVPDAGGFIRYYDIIGNDYLSSVAYKYSWDSLMSLTWYKGDTTAITMKDFVFDEEPDSIEQFLNESDKITGNKYKDTLFGYAGNDELKGLGGNDILNGGVGKDSLTGGNGNDAFIFRSASESSNNATASDMITDFVRGQDKINLSVIDSFAPSGTNNTFVWKGTEAFRSWFKGEVRYEKFDYRGSANDYTMVWIDNDRDKDVEMAIRLTGLHNLTASDFIL